MSIHLRPHVCAWRIPPGPIINPRGLPVNVVAGIMTSYEPHLAGGRLQVAAQLSPEPGQTGCRRRRRRSPSDPSTCVPGAQAAVQVERGVRFIFNS